MHARHAALSLSILSVFALAACGGSDQSEGASGQPSQAQFPVSAPAPENVHYRAELALSGKPIVTADGKDIVVTVSVTNNGPGAFGSSTQPHNVNLGAHAVDGNGKVVVNDLSRAAMPQIASGATRQVSILLPVGSALGHRVELLPVEENVGWFDQWGTKPLIVGPFEMCSGAAAGKVCDASGESLRVVPARQ